MKKEKWQKANGIQSQMEILEKMLNKFSEGDVRSSISVHDFKIIMPDIVGMLQERKIMLENEFELL